MSTKGHVDINGWNNGSLWISDATEKPCVLMLGRWTLVFANTEPHIANLLQVTSSVKREKKAWCCTAFVSATAKMLCLSGGNVTTSFYIDVMQDKCRNMNIVWNQISSCQRKRFKGHSEDKNPNTTASKSTPPAPCFFTQDTSSVFFFLVCTRTFWKTKRSPTQLYQHNVFSLGIWLAALCMR